MTIKHLDTAIGILRAPARHEPTENLRPRYEKGLAEMGFFRARAYRGRSVFVKFGLSGVAYEVGDGDDVRRSKDGGEAIPLPHKARKMILLAGQ